MLFLKDDYWIVRDRVAATGVHRYDLHFHFDTDADPTIETNGDVATAVRERGKNEDAAGLEMFAFGKGGEWRREAGWVSHCYGERSPASVLVFTATGEGEQDFVTFLVPRRAKDFASSVREVETSGDGRAFEVICGERRDVVLLGSGGDAGLVKAARFESDFEWAWARFKDREDGVEQLVLINGRRLLFNGRAILNSDERVEYAVARRSGDELHVETDKVKNLRVSTDTTKSGEGLGIAK